MSAESCHRRVIQRRYGFSIFDPSSTLYNEDRRNSQRLRFLPRSILGKQEGELKIQKYCEAVISKSKRLVLILVQKKKSSTDVTQPTNYIIAPVRLRSFLLQFSTFISFWIISASCVEEHQFSAFYETKGVGRE